MMFTLETEAILVHRLVYINQYTCLYASRSLNHNGGVMVNALCSSVVDHVFESNQRLLNWYLLLLFKACSIKEKEQGLVGSKLGATCLAMVCCFSELALLKSI